MPTRIENQLKPVDPAAAILMVERDGSMTEERATIHRYRGQKVSSWGKLQ